MRYFQTFIEVPKKSYFSTKTYVKTDVWKNIYNFTLKQFAYLKIINEYDQEIPQSQTADKAVASWGRATQQSRDTRKTNKAKQPALSRRSRRHSIITEG